MAEVLTIIVAAPWTSSGLNNDNAFTSVVVLRAAATLHAHKLVDVAQLDTLRHGDRTLTRVGSDLADAAPSSFAVGGHQPQATLAYWYADALDRLNLPVPEGKLIALLRWASSEFNAQLSYVVSGNDVLMDPVAMIMAACLTHRLLAVARKRQVPPWDAGNLPSITELNHGVLELFRHQGLSGIWPKYFPLFYYPQATAGANYCFAFEFLEAALRAFSWDELFMQEVPLSGLERAVAWCGDHRVEYQRGGTAYRGWNSGGRIDTLRQGIPESWATAAVHMFLATLDDTLSAVIDNTIVARHRARNWPQSAPNSKLWDKLLDADVLLTEAPSTVKRVLEEDVITPLHGLGREAVRRKPLDGRHSILLFGPPGTSKTTLARATAERLGWPCIEIHPAAFLNRGLEQIYIRADEIFEDLLDVSGVVILFDEMDALVQRRSGDRALDVTREFLTTSMLPRIAQLYEARRAVLFMATNHRHSFDEAITRPGRFDLLICVGPPNWPEKTGHIGVFLPDTTSTEDVARIRAKLQS